MPKISCLELFAGAGGLAKGIELSGIQHKALIEFNKNACQTLINNYGNQLVHPVDIRLFQFDQLGYIDMVSGGPPCQPFSIGGKHQGHIDERDMFPYACRAIAMYMPKFFIFENVKGLLRPSFSSYFKYITLRLTYPNVQPRPSENWEDHCSRLEKMQQSEESSPIQYNVTFRLVDAANYGIPQRRERVFIVGIRQDLNIQWNFPEETHSLDSLLWSQFVNKDYWERHQIKPLSPETIDQQYQKRVGQLMRKPDLLSLSLKPWRTVRDQIGNLPEPDFEGSFDQEHILREGARIYPGHTGSPMDMPSKTLKAGDHGVPGGENMIRYPDGRVRYYTVFEAKRIQTFPENYRISGSWTESMRQIGNAVPVELSCYIAKSLAQVVENN